MYIPIPKIALAIVTIATVGQTLFASEVATFAPQPKQDIQVTQSSTQPSTEMFGGETTVYKLVPLEEVTGDSTVTMLDPTDPEVQRELALMKQLSKELPTMLNTRATISVGNVVAPIGYDYSLSNVGISESQFYNLFNQRLNAGKLPVRYLPNDYSAHYKYVDKYNLDNTRMYEIIDGYPIFYLITRYSRPETVDQLYHVTDDTGRSADRLTIPMSGVSNVGTLTLN